MVPCNPVLYQFCSGERGKPLPCFKQLFLFLSYRRTDAQPLEEGRPVELKFKLMPTSFKFLKGQVCIQNQDRLVL